MSKTLLGIEAVRKEIESGYLRHADETRWRALEMVEHKTQYVWLFRNQHYAFYTIEDSRSREVYQWIRDGAAGALVADDYARYNAWADENDLSPFV